MCDRIEVDHFVPNAAQRRGSREVVKGTGWERFPPNFAVRNPRSAQTCQEGCMDYLLTVSKPGGGEPLA